MSILYGEDVFRSVELPLIRALLDMIPIAAQHTAALYDVEHRFDQTVGAEAACVSMEAAGKRIWESFAIQNKFSNQKAWRDAIAEERMDDAVALLKERYALTYIQAVSAVTVFQQFISQETPHG